METPDFKNAPILVVEDTTMIRVMLVRYLKQAGFKTIYEAVHGQEALDILKTTPVDIVLLDINMPVLNGYATLEKIRADEKLRDLVVIMVTAVEDIESIAQCIQLGAEDYMPRLFNPILLNARISTYLEKRYLKKRLQELESRDKAPPTP